MSFSHLHFEVEEHGIVLITINRPEKRNALNQATIAELDVAFARVESDRALRGLILTGAGDKAFIAGADIKELAETSAAEAESLSVKGQNVFRRLETMRKPSVAAINGYALGGGLELAMCCTVRIASKDAVLGQPEVKLGIPPGYGATQRLPRLVGRGRALDMLLSAEPVSAEEAHRSGLVNYVVEKSELIPFSRTWLSRVLANGPLALGLTMQAVDAGLDSGIDAGLRFEAMAFGLAAASDDRAEGTRAFLEKRAPVFKGR
ncbi:MAG: short chain enoyl-CoA hydratase [Bryobacterales bacterium]|nr:short chain enoyl-CoA hydratase [Bryobacterales bacterium]